jgi:hypothetical protein
MTSINSHYAATFAAMCDDELLYLAQSWGSLTESAQSALQAEFNKRQLNPELEYEDRPSASDLKHLWSKAASRLKDPRLVALFEPEGTVQAEKQAGTPIGQRPIGGWLYVLASYMVCSSLYGVFQDARGLLAADAQPAHTVLAVFTFVSLPFRMLMVYAGVGLFAKWDGAVKIARISLWAALIALAPLYVVTPVLSVLLWGYLTEHYSSVLTGTSVSLNTVKPVLQMLLSLPYVLRRLLWSMYYALPTILGILYLRKSQRVRQSYEKTDLVAPGTESHIISAL